MFNTLTIGCFKILQLSDGNLLPEAVAFVDKGMADGINLNYIRNWRTDLEPLRACKKIKCLIVNDYPPSMDYDYSAIHSLISLIHLSVNTADKKEIDFTAFPKLTSVTLRWRSKASSLSRCTQLRDLFLGNYNQKDLTELSDLKNLRYLRINLGSVVSLTGLRNISGLEELLLMQATKLENIDDILELKHLKYLRIDNCRRVNNIDSIKKMKIAKLEIRGTTPNG
jgi:hypothetical protein